MRSCFEHSIECKHSRVRSEDLDTEAAVDSDALDEATRWLPACPGAPAELRCRVSVTCPKSAADALRAAAVELWGPVAAAFALHRNALLSRRECINRLLLAVHERGDA